MTRFNHSTHRGAIHGRGVTDILVEAGKAAKSCPSCLPTDALKRLEALRPKPLGLPKKQNIKFSL